MKNSELAAILQAQIDNSITGLASDLEDKSADALDYYYGRPLGTEVEGQSQVVTRDVLETIEWVMPSILRPFVSGERTVIFDAVSQEDEPQADQETDYINHIALRENNGFLFYYCWFKDALLQKNGYAKVWVEEVEKIETQTYSGLNDAAFAQVVNQDNVDPIEHTERIELMDLQTPQGVIQQPVTLHDIKIRVTSKEKKFRLEVIPQEEIRISRKTRSVSLDDSPFVCHERILTVTDLLEMGIDRKTVESLPSYNSDESELEGARKESYEDDTLSDYVDSSMREIQAYECYVRVDYDGDGKAELRRVLMAGGEILENDEADFIPFESITPIIMPHKHLGLGEADLVMDLQLIRTTLMRQMLNNLYLTNNPEKEVVEDWVKLEDLLESAPGNIKRVTQPGAIREIAVPFTAGASLPILDLLDQMQEKRTGISRTTQGMDADVLAQSTKGAFMGALEQANQRVEMIARTFAETGVKGIFKKLHDLVVKHQDQRKVVKIRNKWVDIDPLEWKHRANLSVVVGIGTGNKDQLLSRLFALAEKQEALLMSGNPIVSPLNLYNTYEKIVDAADLKNATLYFTDPRTIPPKPPQPQQNPLAEVEQIKGQFKLQSDQMHYQMRMALAQMEEQNKRETKMMELRLEAIERERDRQSKEAIEAAKAEIQAFLQGLKIDIGQPGIGAGLNAGQAIESVGRSDFIE